jgi:TetR/AcrR family transcriptional regulator, transcriptional repressor for nem operon
VTSVTSPVGSLRVFAARSPITAAATRKTLATSSARVPVDWVARQFEAVGRCDGRDLAIELIARYQGTALLANTFRDPGLMDREAARVARWIDLL